MPQTWAMMKVRITSNTDIWQCLNITTYSLRIAPINDALVRLAGCKAYKNKPYPILLTLYGPRNQLEKSELLYAVEIATLNRYTVVTRCMSWTDLICSDTKNQAVKKWLPFELICAVYLDYIATIHCVCQYPNLLTLYVQNTKTLAVKNWLSFELICAVDLEYIVTIHLVRPYPNLLTLFVQYTKTLAVQKWLPFELICAVYLECLNSIPYSLAIRINRICMEELTRYKQFSELRVMLLEREYSPGVIYAVIIRFKHEQLLLTSIESPVTEI